MYTSDSLSKILTVKLNDGALVPVQEGGEHEGDAEYQGRQQNQRH